MRQYALEELVLGNILREKAIAHPAKTFLKFRDMELTYREVNDMADRMAQGFAAMGVRQHDHVAVMLPNSADFMYVTCALAKIGAVLVPINIAYKGEILHHVLNTSDVSMLVVDEPLLDQAAPVLERLPNLASVIVRKQGKGPEAFRGLPRSAIPLRRLLEHGADEPVVNVRYSDLQAIMYTSGTTGPSKGVMVAHAHMLTCGKDFLKLMDYRSEETIYCPLPLFHAAALWDGAMAALLAGSNIAVVDRFSASRFWDDVRLFGANVAMGVFSMIPILLNQEPTSTDQDHSLRAFYVGKSAQDEAFRARFGTRSVENYASTELGIATCSPFGQWRPGSCGQANEDTFEVKVVDESDREVGPGEPGELVVRPKQPFVMTTGYYNYPLATAKSFRNLWFHTGDRVYRDEDDYFFFVDRIKDSIRRRGENISAFEVEHVVSGHPSVLEAAAFGVPSEMEEDEVKISVVLRRSAELDPAELAAYCEEQLPSFMVPRYIEMVDELPKTPTEKVAKHELRRQGDNGITPQTWDRIGAASRPAGRDKGGAASRTKRS